MQANDKLYEGVGLPTKNIRSPSEHRDHQKKTTHKIMMDGEKDILVGEYRNSQAFAGFHIFARADCIERYMEDVIFRFHETKKDDPIIAATNLLGNIINIHPF